MSASVTKIGHFPVVSIVWQNSVTEDWHPILFHLQVQETVPGDNHRTRKKNLVRSYLCPCVLVPSCCRFYSHRTHSAGQPYVLKSSPCGILCAHLSHSQCVEWAETLQTTVMTSVEVFEGLSASAWLFQMVSTHGILNRPKWKQTKDDVSSTSESILPAHQWSPNSRQMLLVKYRVPICDEISCTTKNLLLVRPPSLFFTFWLW